MNPDTQTVKTHPCPGRKHLTLEERKDISSGLDRGIPLGAIAFSLDRAPSTVSREIKRHLVIRRTGAYGHPFNECINRFSCRKTSLCSECHSGRKRHECRFCTWQNGCSRRCTDFRREGCSRLKKAPYVCNGCADKKRCTLEKHIYDPVMADREAADVLRECRTGIALSEGELKEIDLFISPLMKKGQSLYHICKTQPDRITVSQSTLYRHINDGLFEARNIDLPRKVRFSKRKNKKHHKVDRNCRRGRTYEDFQRYMSENPDTPVVEIDSVEGIKGGKVLLTVYFRDSELQVSVLRDHNDAASVNEYFENLYSKLGDSLFRELFPVILADNGTEFSDPLGIEKTPEGSDRTKVFYCDPSAPNEKGACERNHTEIRRIIPKHTPFDMFTQEDISLMMDHINSFARKAIGGRSSCEMFTFLHGQEAAELLGCSLVPPDEVTLRPKLMKERLAARGINPDTVYKKLIPDKKPEEGGES